MFISLIGIGSETLLQDFDSAGVKYSRKPPKPGVVVNSGELVHIAENAIPMAVGVVIAWLKYRPSRKLNITKNDGTVVMAEGASVGEVKDLLESAKTIIAIETKKPDQQTSKQNVCKKP